MILTRNNKITIVAVSMATAFAAGRFTVSEKIKTVVQTVEVEKKTTTTDTDTDQNKHKKTKTVEVIKPDGNKIITTITVEDNKTDKKIDTTAVDDTKIDTVVTKEVTKGADKVTISALGGVDVSKGHFVYGASVTKPVIGPITFGLFGLSDMTFGASIGLTF